MVLVNFSATIQWLLNMSYNSKTTKLTLNSVCMVTSSYSWSSECAPTLASFRSSDIR